MLLQMALFHSFLWLSNQSLGWEETLERETATNSSFLAWEMPWIEERGRLQSMGSQLDTTELTKQQHSIVYMYYIFFIQSSVDGHLGCFHVLTIMNSAAVNIGVHVSF